MFSTLGWHLSVLVGVSIAIYAATALCGWIVTKISDQIMKEKVDRNTLFTGFFAALPFGLSAIVLGFLSGLSFEPAASALVTGVISLISGAAFVIFTKDIRSLLPVGIVIVVFVLNLLSGATLGASFRDESLAVTEQDIANEFLRNSRIEFRVNNYRQNLGLSKLQVRTSEFMNEPDETPLPD